MICWRVGLWATFPPRLAWLVLFLTSVPPAWCQPSVRSITAHSPQLSRPLRSWEFLPVTGQRAALFGDEQGRMEAWVYPLKLLRDFHVVFHVDGQAIPAESLARSLQVHPESATIRFSGDNFTVHETFFVPVQESGGLVFFDVQTERPLEIEIDFQGAFQLEWPGALGDAFEELASDGRSFQFGEESHRFAGLIGSPTAVDAHSAYETNYYQRQGSSFRLGVTSKGNDTKIVAFAASTQGWEDAARTYHKLISSWPDLLQQSSAYYRQYLDATVALDLPDAQLQQAYDWARISVIQGLVSNPQLGTGLIAGYRTSGSGQRPGFAWFFGRDALWTSFALDAEGDTATTRTALSFISKFQRDDGKIPHEISQAAGYINWFKDFPYAYASADATPLYIIAMNDYLLHSGDSAFVKEQWPSIWKAYQFLRSTWDAQGFPRNEGVGHGWVEGGPLLPVKTELYQTALGTEALHALANLAHITGQQESTADLDQLFAQQKSKMNDSFWLPDKARFAFALDLDNRPVDELSVLATVPMWFAMLDQNKANTTVTQLAAHEHQTDWGMRIISSASPKFNGQGYHFGSVWPLFTGWAAVGEYRYHRVHPAYENLRSNALLALGGSLGHVTEVLSGTSFEQLSTSSPHQIWSAAMVISPLLRGLFGLEKDALARTLTFSPHPPADWSSFAVRNVAIGATHVDLRYSRTATDITLEVTQTGEDNFVLNFEPALSLRAQVIAAQLNGRAVEFRVVPNEVDQHVLIHAPLSTKTNSIRIRLKNDFAFSYNSALPMLGENSRGLRVLSETWSAGKDSLSVTVSGISGRTYDLSLWNPQQIRSVDSAQLVNTGEATSIARIPIPPSATESFANTTVVFHFQETRRR
jgi:GH15 family glucan-1,4-alpha-glucosidase